MKATNKLLRICLALGFILTAITSCKVGYISEARGKAPEAYLQFVQTQTEYDHGVTVTIDGKITFTAKVDKETRRGVKGNKYAIATGRHQVKVMLNEKLLFEKEIFVSSQELKQITLP